MSLARLRKKRSYQALSTTREVDLLSPPLRLQPPSKGKMPRYRGDYKEGNGRGRGCPMQRPATPMKNACAPAMKRAKHEKRPIW